MSYHHLTIIERERILQMHYNKKSMTQITEVINQSKSSISRELLIVYPLTSDQLKRLTEIESAIGKAIQ